MNRAKRYSGPFALFASLLAFGIGVWVGVVVLAPTPIIRTVVQSPHPHIAASMTPAGAADEALRRLAVRTSCAPEPGTIALYGELEGCILAYLNTLQSPQTNREGQVPAATPPPYNLHPGKTPLKDPTTGFPDGSPQILCTGTPAWDMRADAPPRCRKAAEAYYSSLLKSGQFPTSGSSEGRPR